MTVHGYFPLQGPSKADFLLFFCLVAVPVFKERKKTVVNNCTYKKGGNSRAPYEILYWQNHWKLQCTFKLCDKNLKIKKLGWHVFNLKYLVNLSDLPDFDFWKGKPTEQADKLNK